ncbi:MAG: hypothetical protein EAZ89_11325 [Bacteroidetes bacterium]|nr:MAG: hypothetical protein EAZ89_11325 [Bacteroidota bacterium]
MISFIISQAERSIGVPMDYLRSIARGSRSAFWKFMLFMPLSGHRKRLPKELWHAARIVVTQHMDCGACVQITVNMALQEGLPAAWVRAVLNRNEATLSPEVKTAMDYADAVVKQDELAALPLREALLKAYGEAGLVDLALGIAGAQVYPVTKRALGLAVSCSKVEIVGV